MTTHALSVVIPHYGDAAPTRRLVASIRAEVQQLGGTIVVVDDASPLPLDEVPGATVIRREINGGFGATVNDGVARVETDLVAILNSDLIVEEGFLLSWMEAAQPWLPAVVAPRVVTYDHLGACTFRFPGPINVFAQKINLVAVRRTSSWASDLIGEDRPEDPSSTALFDWVSGAAMLLPTEVFRSVDGFDERFHMYLEEVDLQRRLRERGVPSVYVGHVKADHVGFASSDPSKRERWALESWVRYADKWGWPRRLRAAVVVAAGINVVTDGMRRALGRDVNPVDEWRQKRALARDVWAAQARLDAQPHDVVAKPSGRRELGG